MRTLHINTACIQSAELHYMSARRCQVCGECMEWVFTGWVRRRGKAIANVELRCAGNHGGTLEALHVDCGQMDAYTDIRLSEALEALSDAVISVNTTRGMYYGGGVRLADTAGAAQSED